MEIIVDVAILITYLLMYLLAAWNRVLLRKLTGFQPIKNSLAFYRIRIHKYQPPVLILRQLDPIHISKSHFLKIPPNIILPSTPGSPKRSFSLRFPHQNPVYVSLLPHTFYMHRLTNSFRFFHSNINNSILKEQKLKFTIKRRKLSLVTV